MEFFYLSVGIACAAFFHDIWRILAMGHKDGWRAWGLGLGWIHCIAQKEQKELDGGFRRESCRRITSKLDGAETTMHAT